MSFFGKVLFKYVVGPGVAGVAAVTAYAAWKRSGDKPPKPGHYDEPRTTLQRLTDQYLRSEGRPRRLSDTTLIWNRDGKIEQTKRSPKNGEIPNSSLQQLIDIFVKSQNRPIEPKTVSGTDKSHIWPPRRLETIEEEPESETDMISEETQTDSDMLPTEPTQTQTTQITQSTQTDISETSTTQTIGTQTEENTHTEPSTSEPPQTHDESEKTSK